MGECFVLCASCFVEEKGSEFGKNGGWSLVILENEELRTRNQERSSTAGTLPPLVVPQLNGDLLVRRNGTCEAPFDEQ